MPEKLSLRDKGVGEQRSSYGTRSITAPLLPYTQSEKKTRLNPRPLRALAPAASFRGSLRSHQKNMAPHIFQSETELQNIAEAAPSPPSFSVSEKLARYGSSALSGVEHLRLLVGKDSIADALLRQFGSLKALSRASFKELRQFLPKGKAEAVMAALSISNTGRVRWDATPASWASEVYAIKVVGLQLSLSEKSFNSDLEVTLSRTPVTPQVP
jgi:hypothetical protein